MNEFTQLDTAIRFGKFILFAGRQPKLLIQQLSLVECNLLHRKREAKLSIGSKQSALITITVTLARLKSRSSA